MRGTLRSRTTENYFYYIVFVLVVGVRRNDRRVKPDITRVWPVARGVVVLKIIAECDTNISIFLFSIFYFPTRENRSGPRNRSGNTTCKSAGVGKAVSG